MSPGAQRPLGSLPGFISFQAPASKADDKGCSPRHIFQLQLLAFSSHSFYNQEKKWSTFPKLLLSFQLQMGPPASRSTHLPFVQSGKGRHCIFCPITSHPCVYRAPQKRNSHILSTWVEVRIRNFQPFFQIKEHSVLSASLRWKKVFWSDKYLSLCGREAWGDTQTDGDGPELACSFINSMTMKSKLS